MPAFEPLSGQVAGEMPISLSRLLPSFQQLSPKRTQQMPRARSTSKHASDRVTLRLPAEEGAHYRRMSRLKGMTLSAYLTKTLVAGVIAENMAEFEERLGALMERFDERVGALVSRIPGAGGPSGDRLADDIVLSLFTIESMLAAVVEAQDIQTLYAAQEAAKGRLKRRKAA